MLLGIIESETKSVGNVLTAADLESQLQRDMPSANLHGYSRYTYLQHPKPSAC